MGKSKRDVMVKLLGLVVIVLFLIVKLYNIPTFTPETTGVLHPQYTILYPGHEIIIALASKENISSEESCELIKLLDKTYWYVYDMSKQSGDIIQYNNETWYVIPELYDLPERLKAYYSEYWSDEAVAALMQIPQLIEGKYAFPSKIENERIDWDTAFFDGPPNMTGTEVEAGAGNETYSQWLKDTYGVDGPVTSVHLFNLKRIDSIWKMSYSEILTKNYLQPTTTFQEIADQFNANNTPKEPPVRVKIKDLAKSPLKYITTDVEFEGIIYEIRENMTSEMIVTDGYNYIYVFYFDETDCYKGSRVKIIGSCLGESKDFSINGFPLTSVYAEDILKYR